MEHKILPKFRSGKYCQYCNSETETVDMRYGQVQSCPNCGAYVSLNTTTGLPNGIVANSDLRRERRSLHVIVDDLIRRKMIRNKINKIEAKKKLYGYMERTLELDFYLESIAQLTLEENTRIKMILKNL